MNTQYIYDNKNFGKNVTVSTFIRPIKMAYIVPYAEIEKNHWIIDSIFYKSYQQWAGTKTLIIPSEKSKFLNPKYEYWLQSYDPDFIYSYIDLHPNLIERISRLSCPINFIRHKVWSDNWTGCIPNWEQYGIKPISSISTICSPYSKQSKYYLKKMKLLVLLMKTKFPY